MTGVDERWVLRAEDQRTLDGRAAASGIEQDALMESAGTNAAEWILERIRPHRAVVVAGPGGNGGDGLVVARRFHEAGVEVSAYLLTPVAQCTPASRRMAERLEAAGAEPVRPASSQGLASALGRADCIIDGLFGSGLTRPLEGEALRIAERLNGSRTRTISLDLPSGLASDRGELLGSGPR